MNRIEYCQICGKEFKLKNVNHQIVSSTSINYICDTCYDKFIRRCVVKMFVDNPEGFKIDIPLEISEIEKPNQLDFYEYLIQRGGQNKWLGQ